MYGKRWKKWYRTVNDFSWFFFIIFSITGSFWRIRGGGVWGWVGGWFGVCAAVLYHLQLLAVGLTGSVPLQQLFDGGLHTDTLVHPRLVVFWIKRRSSHSAHVYQAVGDNNRHWPPLPPLHTHTPCTFTQQPLLHLPSTALFFSKTKKKNLSNIILRTYFSWFKFPKQRQTLTPIQLIWFGIFYVTQA